MEENIELTDKEILEQKIQILKQLGIPLPEMNTHLLTYDPQNSAGIEE
jgi:hypothetical protein